MMLIALYMFTVNVVIPQVGAYARVLLEPVMAIVITLAAIVMLFGIVGVRISNNLGTTVVNGIFRAIGYVGRSVFRAIRWFGLQIARLIPRVFNGSRRFFRQLGLNDIVSNLLAVIVVVILVLVII